MEGNDPLLQEAALTRGLFDLDEILSFQLAHDVQIVRGEDYQYMCYIDKSVYAIALTPLFAMCYGVRKFKENELK